MLLTIGVYGDAVSITSKNKDIRNKAIVKLIPYAIGIVLGVFLGILLHRFVITTVEVDLMMFGRHIRPESFLICALWTAVFSLAVNAIMYWHFKKIDMIESLKSVE